MKGICELCNKESNLNGHHLSYIPELVVFLCIACHHSIHILARLPEDSLNTAVNWIITYKNLWNKGDYFGSNYYKEYKRKYYKQHKEYWEKNYQLNKDKILKRKKEYYQQNKNKIRNYQKEYRHTKNNVKQDTNTES